MIIHKQFVLLSGGLDSSTILAHAVKNFPHAASFNDERFAVQAVSIDYGQKHSKELDFAAVISQHLGVHHITLPLPRLLSGTMLTGGGQAIPNVSYAEL